MQSLYVTVLIMEENVIMQDNICLQPTICLIKP